MKVLMINGSPREGGNTALAFSEMQKVFEKNGIETEVMQIGGQTIPGCRACGACRKLGRCVIDDVVGEAAAKLAEADGLVIGSPVYYASANGTLVSFLDRLFYSNRADLSMKVGACIAIARRGGTSTTFDELNKYFTISGMPVASSQYWNMAYGARQGEAAEDAEGMRTMRVLAENMSFLIKSIALGKEKYGLPKL
ncbi:MAG: flavodoxin family protein, partial [Firmicutes bacterium]|nr:flavodoxin family protein [Bacillota bacterium]